MRCKACNNKMKPNESKWIEELKRHEDLCLVCRQSVYEMSIEDLETMDKLEEEGL